MRCTRSTLGSMFAGWVAIAAAGCGQRVSLGAIADGGASVLWRATFEPGNLSEWTSDGNGGSFAENAAGPPVATTDVAHNGSFAGAATIAPAMAMPSYNYLFRREPSPPEAYYSAWFYIPSRLTVPNWLSVHHFVASAAPNGAQSAIWDVNLYSLPSGALTAQLFDYEARINTQQPNPMPIPIATWVHFEVLLRKAADTTGRVAVWQDGVLILDRPAAVTARNPWVTWEAGASSADVTPSPALIYIDDAAISLSRLGITGN